ncbi:hypothetical protein DICVIV_05383 [Dictyocaulus viviparus]|uniref:Protein kinase domain-containing protein n=1 Tax=Dictyocaulus viviparus TaxID=29172 RepID=A0A0D8XV31_DICVI|nr:hypothetical protein DICVIV_05383 [Dictyocaulus viviparus]
MYECLHLESTSRNCSDELEYSDDCNRRTRVAKYIVTLENRGGRSKRASEISYLHRWEENALKSMQNECDAYDGMTLEQFFHKHGPFPIEEHIAALILRNIASAVMFLHSRDVVHGSLDSSSIVIDSNFHAKLIVSTSIHRVRPSKPGMKPKAEDVHSLGILLYRMLTGHTAKFNETEEEYSIRSKSEIPFKSHETDMPETEFKAFIYKNRRGV